MQKLLFDNLVIYTSIYEYASSNMYVIIEDGDAIVVDPHKSDEIFKLLKLNNVKNVLIILTHEHSDHISGVYWLQENFNSKLLCSKNCAEYISKEQNVRPILITFILEEKDRINGTKLLEKFENEFVKHTYEADLTFDNQYKYEWKSHKIDFFALKGHSQGSCVIILDEKLVFTGDTILKDMSIITRFPGGNKKIYQTATLPFLAQKLNSEMDILPGHGEHFKLREIMKDGKINVEFR